MKFQWSFILTLLFALIVAVFAVINVKSVQIDYLFGTTRLPLILIILGSALLGGFIVGSIGLLKNLKLKRHVKLLIKEKTQLEEKIRKIPENKEIQNSNNVEQISALPPNQEDDKINS